MSQPEHFFDDLKDKIARYFSAKKLHPAGNGKLYAKAGVQVFMAAALYSVLIFFTPPPAIAALLCIVLGLNLAVIGFNVMHEGGHQTFSRHPWINKSAAYFLNILGGNSYYWKIKHNVNHHTYTNIEGLDSDIDVKPFMRLHAGQPWRPYHRFQHIYWILLYSISYLAWIFYEDFQKYVTGKVSVSSKRKSIGFREHLIFWFTKGMFVVVYMVIPVMIVGWLPWLIGFCLITFTCGLAISVVFQLAHVVEGTKFYASSSDGTAKKDWAIHQLSSTANFATSNQWLYWLLGGLNFQIEHHLFPRVSHIHYPAISTFVRQACKECNLTYNEYSSMLRAFASHLQHLRRLGRTPQLQHHT